MGKDVMRTCELLILKKITDRCLGWMGVEIEDEGEGRKEKMGWARRVK